MNRHPLTHFFARLSRRFPALAVATGDGRLLMSASLDPAEAGLMPTAIETAARYFPMSEGDFVLLKDPFAGGPGRDGLTIVTCWRAGEDPSTRLMAATTVHDGTLRALKLPPAPLKLMGETNAGVVEALGPVRERVTAAAAALDEARAALARPPVPELLTKKSLADAAAFEQQRLKNLCADLPEGEAEVELKLPIGETLKVRLRSEGRHLEFDFSGTSPGRALQMPLAAATGIWWSAIRERLGLDPAVDAASASFFPVAVPNGCFLNAKSGDCDRGLDDGTPWLQWAAEQLVHKWDRRRPRGLVNPFDLEARIDFGGGRVLKLELPSGGPARDETEGATFVQQRTPRAAFSIENLEKNWPVKFHRVDERVSLHGKGKVAGGRGLHCQFEVLAPAKLTWSPTPPTGRSKHEKHQSLFDNPAVHVRHADADREQPAQEPHALAAGDVVTLLSGSGGGLV